MMDMRRRGTKSVDGYLWSTSLDKIGQRPKNRKNLAISAVFFFAMGLPPEQLVSSGIPQVLMDKRHLEITHGSAIKWDGMDGIGYGMVFGRDEVLKNHHHHHRRHCVLI